MVKKIRTQSQTLSGSPLSQFVDFSPSPIIAQRAPTSLDTGYALGQEWVFEGNSAYILVEVSGGSANWEAIGGGGVAISQILPNIGSVVTPVAGKINLFGDAVSGLISSGVGDTLTLTADQANTSQRGTLETATDAETSAMTSTDVALTPSNLPQILFSPFIVGPTDAPYTTIQSAMDAANALPGLKIIYVRPGNYPENLLLYSGIQLIGLSDTGNLYSYVTITGQHVPPTTGTCLFANVTLVGAPDIFNNVSFGEASLALKKCIISVDNGYTFNLPNWTTNGTIYCEECQHTGINNGEINNNNTVFLYYLNTSFGIGDAISADFNGDGFFYNVVFGCPISIMMVPLQFLQEDLFLIKKLLLMTRLLPDFMICPSLLERKKPFKLILFLLLSFQM
ncbi:hypothetical protein HC928_02560 [bacterium]|nr:hypothetical protein [bacterium]